MNIKTNNIELAFFAILFFTLLNGFFNSMNVAYGHTGYPLATFLFDSSDLHADLVKGVLSFYQGKILSYSDWSPLYQGYYLYNPYGGVDALNAGQLSNLSGSPMMTAISLLLGKLVLWKSPGFLVKFFYVGVFMTTWLIAYFYSESTKKAFFVSIILLFSYPVLFILTRGHIFSFIGGVLLIFFFYHIVKKSPLIIPVLLLAFVVNFRPNAAVLSLLFIVYGFKDGIRGLVIFGVLSLSIFYVNLLIAHQMYPDYTFEHFVKAVGIYFNIYVLGNGGDAFNNSLFGGIKALSVLVKVDISEKLKFLNFILSLTSISVLLFSVYLFVKNKINRYELSFIGMSTLALATSVFSTYHMVVFFAFLLIAFKDIELNYSPIYLNTILLTCIFVLSPKNYIFTHGISLEVILNPLVLLWAVAYILYKANTTEPSANMMRLDS
ncbi:hypothetical protein [Sulfuricurvum sp.]|uniref:hypothetical protein n=1 Tax=Sulfuricurvum sp. TaxID=2025608 RepID=UPI002E3657D6|nr:hypothetical protein [Sulfuricurvum sp.]HEX5329498.1 hypothetical protein [Sulfuricurvum sp.]